MFAYISLNPQNLQKPKPALTPAQQPVEETKAEVEESGNTLGQQVAENRGKETLTNIIKKTSNVQTFYDFIEFFFKPETKMSDTQEFL